MGAASFTAETPATATAAEQANLELGRRYCRRSTRRQRKAAREARVAAKDFPALAAIVEAWCVLSAEACRTGNIHTMAEHGEGDEEAADDAWQPALEAACQAAKAMLLHPVTTLDEARAKSAAYQATKIINPDTHDETHEAEALRRDLQAVAASPDRTAWVTAQAAYELARAKRIAASVAEAPAWAAFFAAVPQELVHPNLGQGVHYRWNIPEELKADALVTDEDRRRLLPLLDSERTRFEDFLGSLANEEGEELCDAEEAAEATLLALDPPDAAALAYRMQLVAREADDQKLGFDDLGYVSYLSDHYEGAGLVNNFRSILRLGGLDHPILHMARFSPRRWVSDYSDLGGWVSQTPSRELLIGHPAFARQPDVEDAAAMREELAETPWKYHAVALYAQARRHDGGDPLYCARFNDYHGNRRAKLGRVVAVDRVDFGRAPSGPGSIAEYGVEPQVTTLVLGPSSPTEIDILASTPERRERLEAVALETPEGREALANVKGFDADAWIAAFESHPGQFIDEYGHPCFYDPSQRLSRGPEHSSKAPDSYHLAWADLTAWQRRAVVYRARNTPRKLKIMLAIEKRDALMAERPGRWSREQADQWVKDDRRLSADECALFDTFSSEVAGAA